MADRPAMSKGEIEVARVLADLKKATVQEVHEAFPAERVIDFATVQTYLRRLETKGDVQAELDGRTRVYTPRVKLRTVIRETLDNLIDRLFCGETLPLVRHLIEERGVSDSELADLRQLIARLEKGRS